MSQDEIHRETSPALDETEAKGSLLRAIRLYVDSVRTEMRLVSWPTWKQVRSTTFVVIFFAFAMAAFLTVIGWIGESFDRLLFGGCCLPWGPSR
jgi:preprotein translocase SecE subunit